MHTLTTNLKALWDVTLAALILGAGLPIIFAVGVRLWSSANTVGAEGAGGRQTTESEGWVNTAASRNYPALAGAWACFALVLAAIVTGILYTAKAFLAAKFGIHLFGQA
ncbi:hypothetical protein AB0C65_12900 [Nocardia sp. NPDC048505]|uniref:hypothetical protein n=1 Tax=Nocardia sp. NPDC048505 TaxID=3155756 RepID=UPI00340EAFAD